MTGRRWELRLPYQRPPLSLNGRAHWAVAHGKKTELQNAVRWLLLEKPRMPALDHAWIWLEWTPSVNRRRDTDNPEPTRKAVVDAIVAAGLLPDDTPEFVTRPENVIHPPAKGLARLVVVITDRDPLLDAIDERRADPEFMGRLQESVAANRPILDRLSTGEPS